MSRRRTVVIGCLVALGVVALAAVWVGVRGKQAADALERARSGVTGIRSALEAGDVAAAQQRLVVVRADTARAARATDDPLFRLAAALPVVGNTPTAVRQVAATADNLSSEVLVPLVDAATVLSPQSLRLGPRQLNVAALEQAQEPVAEAVAGAEAAAGSLADVPTEATPAVVDDAVTALGDELADVHDQLTSIQSALQVAPGMLGADGSRRYLLMLQSNNEARGTGGLLGTYGILRFDQGAVTIETLEPRSDLDTQVYDTPPLDFGRGYRDLYGDQVGSWASANLSPHYPYAAQLWLRMWQDRTGERLDGVITTDPVTVSYLLRGVGGFTLFDGRKVDADSFVPLTESTVYSLIDDDRARDVYLKRIGFFTLNRVLAFSGNPRVELDALAQAAGERRLLVYSAHPDEQQVLADMAVGGQIPDGPGPMAGVAFINGAGNKMDYYLRPGIDYALLGCDGDTQRTRITVTLTNEVPRGAGLPTYVIGRVDLQQPGRPVPTRGGDTRDYVQVYVAEGAELLSATVDGRPVALQRGVERGRPVFRTDLEIPAGGTVTLTLDLQEPAVAGPARVWSTPLVKQPTVSADSFECAGQV